MPGMIPSPATLVYSDKRPKTVSDGIIPRAPNWLTKGAQAIYKSTSKDIVKLGIAGKCDSNVLAIFSMQYDRLITLSKIEDRGPSDEKRLNDLASQCLSLIKELGISPTARAKLRIGDVEKENSLDKFFDEDAEETKEAS